MSHPLQFWEFRILRNIDVPMYSSEVFVVEVDILIYLVFFR